METNVRHLFATLALHVVKSRKLNSWLLLKNYLTFINAKVELQLFPPYGGTLQSNLDKSKVRDMCGHVDCR
jgi:hypothetical protein